MEFSAVRIVGVRDQVSHPYKKCKIKTYINILFRDKRLFILDVDNRPRITWILHQQLWGYRVQEKLHVGIREQRKLNTAGI
jgi:hypothetical protein